MEGEVEMVEGKPGFTYRKRNGGPITDKAALRGIADICSDPEASTETDCVLADGETFPWEAIVSDWAGVDAEEYPWAYDWLQRYEREHSYSLAYHGVVYACSDEEEPCGATEWTARFALDSVSPLGPAIVWRDLGDGLRPYDAFGQPADKWSDRPSRLYAINHCFSGERGMPTTFDEVEDEVEREPYEDELISFVFTDSDIVAAGLTNGGW